jgi:hypothetical protein
MILDLLKEHTPAEMPEMAPFKKRLVTISGLRPEDVNWLPWQHCPSGVRS